MERINIEHAEKYIDYYIFNNLYINGKLFLKVGDRITPENIEFIKNDKDNLNFDYIYVDNLSTELSDYQKELNRIIVNNFKSRLNFIFKSFNGGKDDLIFKNYIENIFKNKFIKNNISNNNSLLFSSNKYLLDHSMNVSIISGLMAYKSNLGIKEIEDVLIGGLIHDIGLSSFSCNSMKNICSEKNKEISDYFKEHVVIGFKKVEKSKELSNNVKRIVLLHHVWNDYENSNIKGEYLSYPREFKGNIIDGHTIKDQTLSIVQTADSFERFLSLGMTKKESLKEILKFKETKYGIGGEILKNTFNFS